MGEFPNKKTQFSKENQPEKNGRKKDIPNTKTRLLRFLNLVQQKKNPVTGEIEEFTVAEQMDMAVIAKALRGDLKAYTELLDRMEGKARQSVDATVKQVVVGKDLEDEEYK